MKVSVSLSEDDVAFVDAYARSSGAPSRSSVLHEAVRLLREQQLAEDYERAWDEWDAEDGSAWAVTSADGVR